jgi:hypothetical protein
LPVVDEVAADYDDDVRFVAVAGRGSLEDTAAEASALFSRLDWGLDDAIWDLYGVPGQPVTFLITGSDVVADTWAGALGEDEIRSRLDALVGLGA